MTNTAKPCRLELNNSGSWKKLGNFDAADEQHADLVMNTAEALIKALNNGAPPRQCASLRISMDDGLGSALSHWTAERGGWHDARGGGSHA